MQNTLRAQIFIVMLITSFVNVTISVALFFLINRFIIDNTYIKLMVNRYTNIVQEHYDAGKSDALLPDSITHIENTYGPFLYNTILITKSNNQVVYPAQLLHVPIDTHKFSRRFEIHMHDGSVMYLFPSTDFSDYPPLRGFTGYTIGLVFVMLLCTSAVTGLIGAFLLLQVYRSVSMLVQLLRQHQPETNFVTRLMPSMPQEIFVLAQALDERDTQIHQRTDMQRQLIADVAHELRNPLNTINGYVEAIRDGDLEPTIPRLTLVHDEIQALNRLINDMLIISLAEINQLPLHMARINVHTFANNIYQLMYTICQSQHIKLVLNSTPPAVDVMMDTGRMTRVFTNLIDNAIRHTPANGVITLHVTYTDDVIIFAVVDDGDGIDDSDIPHIFERFYRGSRPNGEGTGLGLAIAKAIIEAHHGTIAISSTLNQGTTIHISLPRIIPSD